MKIKVNNELRDIVVGTTLAELLASEGVADKGGLAVAVNGRVVRRPNWAGRILEEGDNLLIIKAAYGG